MGESVHDPNSKAREHRCVLIGAKYLRLHLEMQYLDLLYRCGWQIDGTKRDSICRHLISINRNDKQPYSLN